MSLKSLAHLAASWWNFAPGNPGGMCRKEGNTSTKKAPAAISYRRYSP